MFILLTNDDGFNAMGLTILSRVLRDIGHVIIVAPNSEKSAVGHAITLADPLRVTKVEKDGALIGYSVNGTPADCVKIAVRALLDRKPDVVVSGINLGGNTGINVIYSGTVSAATEGTMLGIPSIAVSLATFSNPDFTFAADFTKRLVLTVMEKGLPSGTLLNVNIPPCPRERIKGVIVTRQGKAVFEEVFDRRVDPWNRVYYWMAGEKVEIHEEGDVDDQVVKENRISITPIQYDLTDYKSIELIKKWDLKV